MSVWQDVDRRFMREALRLAARARGQTKPNPIVGAVIVKAGRVLARGYHHGAGLPHAEIDALSKLGMSAPGATLYVTLEPCCHQGRTPPCTDSILRAGIRRIVVGCSDDNPIVSGRGIAILRRAGLRVDVGCLEAECRLQNRVFFTWIRRKRPWITLKVASTLDGFIGDRNDKRRTGQTRFITGSEARRVAHELRARHDAVLVGIGTVVADDPLLTVRLPGSPVSADPLRIILDSQLRTKPTARVLRQPHVRPPVLVAAKRAATDRAFDLRRRKLERVGAEVLTVPSNRLGGIALPSLLRVLAAREIQSILVEGGSKVHGSFISAGLVDSVAMFLAPRLVAGGVPIVEGTGLDWRHPAKLGPLSVRPVGDDLLVTADVVERGGNRQRRP